MKRLLLLAAFFIPSSLFADTVTSGSIGLLKPSTGVYSTRSWADKLNGNFDMIAATMTGMLGQINGLNTSTTSLSGFIDSANSTMTALSASTTTLRNITNALNISTTQITALNTSTTTIGNNLATRTQVWSDEGSALSGGHVTRVDCVGDGAACTQSGSTVTLTASGGGGTVGNSTNTLTIAYAGSVFLSTIGIMGVPGAWASPGRSTWNIVGLTASLLDGSTVAMTRVVVNVSTGGQNGLPVLPTFPNVDVPTATASSPSYSIFYTTGFAVRAGEWIGVQVTTGPISGDLPRGLQLDIKYWEKPFGSSN